MNNKVKLKSEVKREAQKAPKNFTPDELQERRLVAQKLVRGEYARRTARRIAG